MESQQFRSVSSIQSLSRAAGYRDDDDVSQQEVSYSGDSSFSSRGIYAVYVLLVLLCAMRCFTLFHYRCGRGRANDNSSENAGNSNANSEKKKSSGQKNILLDELFEAKTCKKELTANDFQEMGPRTDDEDHDDDDDLEMGTSTRGMPIQLSNTKQLKTYDGCAICLEGYSLDETIVWSSHDNCPHVFHQPCLQHYFSKIKGTTLPCPCCRQEFYCLPTKPA